MAERFTLQIGSEWYVIVIIRQIAKANLVDNTNKTIRHRNDKKFIMIKKCASLDKQLA